MRSILIGSSALFVAALGAVGSCAAGSEDGVRYANSLPACYSKTSPILDSHYGYDDRDCSKQLVEGRAADLGGVTSHTHYANYLPECLSYKSPILDPHYGYDDRSCAQRSGSRGG